MTTDPMGDEAPVLSPAVSDPVAMLDDVPLTAHEAGYVEAARAANTLRRYRSDWREFCVWCSDHGDRATLPAAPATLTGYLSELAQAGAKVGTLSRRLSTIKFVHQLHDLPDPTRNAPRGGRVGRASVATTAPRPTRLRR